MLKIDKMHPMDEYLELLQSSGQIFIDNKRLDDAVSDSGYTADDLRQLALLELRIESSGAYQILAPECIIEYLESIGIDIEKRCRLKGRNGYTLDMHRVVEPLIESGVAVEVLSAYKDFRSYRSYSNFLTKLAEQKTYHHTNTDGHAVLVYPTTVTERENLRAYYSNIAVVSIPKLYSSIVTGPSEGYHLAWCDYPQADWRFAYNLFIKDESNAGVMYECADAYEGLARIVEGESFDKEAFTSSRKDYKVNALKVFYNSRDNRAIPTAMRSYFSSRQKYKDYVFNLRALYKFKLPIPCTSYFGYEQMIPEAAYEDAFLSKGLNTPIQTFTSHIVNETVFGVLEKFWSLGYTKDDINVYYVRHDEPIFYFRDTIIKDAWVFQDCSEIFIEGFTPIKLEFHFGDFYKEDSEALNEQISLYLHAHPEKISKYSGGSQHDYSPVPSVEYLYVQMFDGLEPGDKWFLVFYDYRTDKRLTATAKSSDPEDALHEGLLQIFEAIGKPKYILLQNGSLSFMDALETGEEEDTLLKVINGYDSRVALTSLDDFIRGDC